MAVKLKSAVHTSGNSRKFSRVNKSWFAFLDLTVLENRKLSITNLVSFPSHENLLIAGSFCGFIKCGEQHFFGRIDEHFPPGQGFRYRKTIFCDLPIFVRLTGVFIFRIKSPKIVAIINNDQFIIFRPARDTILTGKIWMIILFIRKFYFQSFVQSHRFGRGDS